MKGYSLIIRIQIDHRYWNLPPFLMYGVPKWIQSPDIPRCPISNEVMRFVCSVNSDTEIKEFKNVLNRETSLMFGDHGILNIFFNPETKVLFAKWEW